MAVVGVLTELDCCVVRGDEYVCVMRGACAEFGQALQGPGGFVLGVFGVCSLGRGP